MHVENDESNISGKTTHIRRNTVQKVFIFFATPGNARKFMLINIAYTGHDTGICIIALLIYRPIFALNKVFSSFFFAYLWQTELNYQNHSKRNHTLPELWMQARSLYWIWCNKICVPWNNSRKCLYIELSLSAAHRNKHRMRLTNVVQFLELMTPMSSFFGWIVQKDELLVLISLMDPYWIKLFRFTIWLT